jgi:hypothetical protein
MIRLQTGTGRSSEDFGDIVRVSDAPSAVSPVSSQVVSLWGAGSRRCVGNTAKGGQVSSSSLD